jgi:hypothetical protein
MSDIFSNEVIPLHPLEKYKRYTKFQLIERITELNELVIRTIADSDKYRELWLELVRQNEVTEVLSD